MTAQSNFSLLFWVLLIMGQISRKVIGNGCIVDSPWNIQIGNSLSQIMGLAVQKNTAIYDPTVDNQWHNYPCNQKNFAHHICHIIVEWGQTLLCSFCICLCCMLSLVDTLSYLICFKYFLDTQQTTHLKEKKEQSKKAFI